MNSTTNGGKLRSGTAVILAAVAVFLLIGCAGDKPYAKMTGFDIYKDADGSPTGYVEKYEIVYPPGNTEVLVDILKEAL